MTVDGVSWFEVSEQTQMDLMRTTGYYLCVVNVHGLTLVDVQGCRGLLY